MDGAYIQKVLEGDIDSFKYLVDKYKDMSFSIASSVLKDEYESEDAVQDAFIKAFRNLKSFRNKSAFSTWLYKIVVNESLGRLRKRKQTKIVSNQEYDQGYDMESDSIVFSLAKEEQKRYINQTLEEMDGKESLLLRLFYLNENSLNEIHEITGFSLSNIRVILYRARKNFYSLLNSELKQEIRSIL